MAEPYLPRIVDAVIGDLLRDFPGLLLTGARATGKTTSAKRHAASVVQLDDEDQARVFRHSPDAALARLPEPILLDEWQHVPGVLAAVKRAIDSEPGRGRFIVTGSVRDDMLRDARPITGRLLRLEVAGISARELHRRDLTATPFLKMISERGVESIEQPIHSPDLGEYVDLALQSGFPEIALRIPPARRRNALLSYLEQLLVRDAPEVDVPRDPAKLLSYVEAYALNTAGEAADRTLYEAAGINRRTADAYERLLTTLMLVESLPAWHSNRLMRLVKAPKRYVRDPALAAALLRSGADDLFASGALLGRMIDTFVLAQLRAEHPLYDSPPRLHHLRQEGGAREIDIVAELNYRTVVGLEIKAGGGPSRHDARHLIWLRDQLGDQFAGGVVLHTGRYVYPLDDRIVAAPIACIWN